MPDRTNLATAASAATTTRRRFIAGALATGALAACNGSDRGDGSASSDGSGGSGPTGGVSSIEPGAVGLYTIVQRFPQGVLVPGEVRLPISLSSGAAEFVQDGPATLGAQVTDIDGAPIGGRITAIRRDVSPAPYYAFRPVVEAAGQYRLLVDGGPPDGAAFQVNDRAGVPVPVPGDLLPGFETPTIGDPQGVDPICTRTPECPFHTISLAAALNVDRPLVYCVGTPAFCQTGSCSPALEALIEIHPDYEDRITFVHAEIYTDNTATTVAPAVEALGLFYEPALFVTDRTGLIVERLDGLWDATEVIEVLEKLS